MTKTNCIRCGAEIWLSASDPVEKQRYCSACSEVQNVKSEQPKWGDTIPMGVDPVSFDAYDLGYIDGILIGKDTQQANNIRFKIQEQLKRIAKRRK